MTKVWRGLSSMWTPTTGGWFFLLYSCGLVAWAAFADQKTFLFVLAAGALVQGLALLPLTRGMAAATRPIAAASVVLLLTWLGATFSDVRLFLPTVQLLIGAGWALWALTRAADSARARTEATRHAEILHALGAQTSELRVLSSRLEETQPRIRARWFGLRRRS